MPSNKVNSSLKSPAISNSPSERQITKSRAIVALTLLTLSVGSFFMGKGYNSDKELSEDKAGSADANDNKIDAGIVRAMLQRNMILQSDINSCRQEIETWEFLSDSGEDECIWSDNDIEERANELILARRRAEAESIIARLGITNEEDIQRLMRLYEKGYKIDEMHEDGGIMLSDPNNDNDMGEYFELEEEVDIPSEFESELDNREKTEEETAFGEMMKAEDYEGAVQTIDADSLIEEMENDGIEGTYLEKARMIKEVQNILEQGGTVEQMRLVLCQYIISLMALTEVDDEHESYDEGIENNSALNSFFNSHLSIEVMSALMSLAEIDVEEDSQTECFTDVIDMNWRNMLDDFNQE